MLDILNEQLIAKGEEPIAFDHDCREGICGMCSLMINGVPHGGRSAATTACQLHMRIFKDGDEIWIEPWRAARVPGAARPRASIAARSTASSPPAASSPCNAGSAPDANGIPVPKADADRAFDAAACIGCGACVAACPNASAMLFTAAKLAHLTCCRRASRSATAARSRWCAQMDAEGFGNCTNHRECEAACPKEISIAFIARMNRDFTFASATQRAEKVVAGPG